MIIWIVGCSASGKSTINYSVVKGLGVGYRNKKHSISFYSFNDIIAVGRYARPGRLLNGTDGIMEGKEKLKKFIRLEYKNWRHILLEGTKFVNEEMFNFVIQYDLKIFYINPPIHIILERSKERNNAWDNNITWKKRLSEKKKYDKIVNNEKYKKYIEVRENLNMEQSKNISNEIIKIMNPKLTGVLPI